MTRPIGGARAPELARLTAPDLIGLAAVEFRDLIGAKGAPTVARVRHWPLGLPQYGAGHQRLTGVLRTTYDRQPGLFLAGNYFAGPSVAACLTVAQETPPAVDDYLEAARSGESERVREFA